jgi:H+/gluconate symporter-like permease
MEERRAGGTLWRASERCAVAARCPSKRRANGNCHRATSSLASRAGAIGLPHVTDSLFRLVKEYLGRTVRQALRTITVGTTIAPVIGLARVRPSAKSSEEST